MTEKPENFANAQKYEIKLPAGQIPRCQTCKSTMKIIRPTKAKYVLTLKDYMNSEYGIISVKINYALDMKKKPCWESDWIMEKSNEERIY